ncbi:MULTISPECIES: type II toxin-antitoxin system RelE/ParE family toxin [unclassified Imperialibacter]|uniref:type II toxin-antitoxin system RelE family toxin n=1 Tax=unclassified Imperialibacter TaxID=2629706 RepID=UPI0012562CA7|nr:MULTISPECIES: type II toxin-antitoxin system RelE/ParE family toxin [unclassified Imperialibacter]CAD5293478.1 putative toxin RelE2 [Imperialibacter sp. 89]CAD5294558.1 putative toxin RelE2 [Imperialibacter sp. 75]VVT18182.1 putative toxin RelE2 [Imperialibacter sp. EC-SDR9]
MIIEFDKSFAKSLDKTKNRSLYHKIEKLISELEKSDSVLDLPNIKKLTGFKNYYRARIGEYRIGFEKINETTFRFIIVAHRKDIYKLFP